MNRWTLTEKVREKFIPIVQRFIGQVELQQSPDLLELDLSETELNPFTLVELLEGLGYKNVSQDTCGWQFDFWMRMEKEGYTTLRVDGTGIIFELKLIEHE